MAMPSAENRIVSQGLQGTPHPLDVIDTVATRTQAPVEGNRTREPSEVLKWGVRYVTENFDKGMTLDDVASGTGLSKFHFLRRFRDEAGMTPGLFLQRYRIAAAMEQLAATERPVREIAKEVGYTDAAAFSRAFHRVIGTQPRLYRNARRKAAQSAPGAGP